MSEVSCELPGRLERSALYRDFVAERDEILRHRWLESEKAGRDIGFETALVSWVVHHRAKWLEARRAVKAGPARGNGLASR